MTSRFAVPGLLAALTLTACGGDAGRPSGEWAGSVTDSAGVRIVSNSGAPLWDAGAGWSVEDGLRIGEAAGAPEYQFGQISGIGVASDGRILVCDQQGQHVKVFAPDGTWERTIGEPGSGPGQFGPQAGPVLVGRGDTVLVPDLGNQRMNVVSPDGEMLGSFRLGLEQGIPIRWEMTSGGTSVVQIRALDFPGRPGADAGGAAADPHDAIVTRAYDGSTLDTVLMVPSGRTFSFAGGQPKFHFFSPEPIWALLADGEIALGVNDDMEFRVYGPEAELRSVFRKPYEPRAVTEADRRVFMETLERLWKQAGVPPEGLQVLTQGVSFEDRFPAFAVAFGGPAGSLWVQRIRKPDELSAEEREEFNPLQNLGSPDWDVFDAQGRYLGVVTMPERFQPVGFDGDRVFGVWRDEMDVQYVRFVRIVGAA